MSQAMAAGLAHRGRLTHAIDQASEGVKEWIGTILPPAPGARQKIGADELKVTAHHEAGHAVIHHLQIHGGRHIQNVTIVPRRDSDGTSLGFVMRGGDEDRVSLSKSEALATLRMFLGGRAAEEILLGPDRLTTGSGGEASSDLARATRIGSYLIARCGFNARNSLVYRDASVNTDPALRREVDVLLRELYDSTLDMLRQKWPLVQVLAERLLVEQELSGDEVRRILAEVDR